MKIFTILNLTKFATGVCLILLIGCGGGSGGSNNTSNQPESSATDSSVGNGMASGINAINEAMQLSNNGLQPGSGAVSFHIPKHQFSLISPAYAALGAGGCQDSDSGITVKIDCDDNTSDSDSDTNPEIAHMAPISRHFAPCSVTNRDGDIVHVTGDELIQWTNMGNNSCISDNKRPNFWSVFQGQGSSPNQLAMRVMSTDSNNPTSPQSFIIRTYPDGTFLKVLGQIQTVFSGYTSTPASQTQSVDGVLTIPSPGNSRIFLQSNGTSKIFDHTISTPTPLQFTDTQIGNDFQRTVNSGELDISHNLAKFTVHETFSNVKWDYKQCECLPVSGSLNVTVTDNTTGNNLGSGNIQFTGCDSKDVTYQGRSIHFPSLERCR